MYDPHNRLGLTQKYPNAQAFRGASTSAKVVVATEMNACFSAEERAQLAEEIPAGRFGAPEEVASLAVQITTGNDYLTGQIITLDGGYL